MNTVYLSLGTNLGDKPYNLTRAIQHINERIGPVKAQSSFIETEPWGFHTPNTFLNAAVCVETELQPQQLLEATQAIERLMGRDKKTEPTTTTKTEGCPIYHDRLIDIDILLYYVVPNPCPDPRQADWGGSVTISSPTLTIPHPHMRKRDFVLIPLNEILLPQK